jgi:hypothetical protein
MEFNGGYFDPVPFLNKNHVDKSGPNKKIVRFLWVVIGVAFIDISDNTITIPFDLE